MSTTTFGVDGMTCGHCVQHVTTELVALPGVTDVDITLVVGGSSQVTVTSSAPLAERDVAGAIDEAGYVITPRRSLL